LLVDQQLFMGVVNGGGDSEVDARNHKRQQNEIKYDKTETW
jgi:hypothetical protein